MAHQRLTGVLIKQLVLQLSAHRGGNIGPRLLLVLGLALLPGLLERGGRNLLAVDLEPVLGRTEGEIDDAVGAPQREDQDQQSQYEEGQPALALEEVTDVLQHIYEWRSGRDSNPRPPA